jgi:hypothetical protein
METLADRVRKRMEKIGLGQNQSELARRITKLAKPFGYEPIKPQNIQQLLDGTVKHPHYLVFLAEALETTAEELITGRPSKYEKGGAQLTAEQARVLSNLEVLTEEQRDKALKGIEDMKRSNEAIYETLSRKREGPSLRHAGDSGLPPA